MSLSSALLFGTLMACMAGAPKLLTLESAKLLEDSEFSITFPEEKHPGIRTVSAKALRSHIEAAAHSSKKQLMSGVLDPADYKSLIEMLRQLDESDLERKLPEGCIEPYNIRLRVATKQEIYAGCRGPSPNATVVSKVVRQLEILLIKGSAD